MPLTTELSAEERERRMMMKADPTTIKVQALPVMPTFKQAVFPVIRSEAQFVEAGVPKWAWYVGGGLALAGLAMVLFGGKKR